jgi:cation diffusion facilitator CzcD-associated flavoprotein CzcO
MDSLSIAEDLRQRVSRQRSGRNEPRVAVIGAGFGGIAAASYMVRSGFQDFVIFERSDGVGGVWRQNTYPGAEVDTFSDWYSYKFKSYDWPRPHSGQGVLVEYLEDTVKEYALHERLELGANVASVTWNDRCRQHTVTLADGRTERFDVVISAIGLFNIPNVPSWPGLDRFRGPVFHASRWEHEHDLAGKRVALVGAGSSGVQIAVELAKTAKHLYVIQRDPNWINPKNNRDYTEEERARRRVARNYRRDRLTHFRNETKLLRGGKVLRPGTKEDESARRMTEQYIDSILGDRPELKAAVMPNHAFFAKRPVKNDGFYEALLQDNVTFARAAVCAAYEDGLIDDQGREYPVDAVVLATGFRVPEFLEKIDVTGPGGASLHDFWAKRGGPEAFLGMTVPGFPNFYIMYGPNTNMGQIVFGLEAQARYIVRNLKRMRRSGVTALEVRPVAHRWYNRLLQHELRRTVWPDANNYLKAKTGKVVVPFPRPMVYYWALSRGLRRIATRRVTGRPARQWPPK